MTESNDFLDNLGNHQHQKMLREIANDNITPKKSDKMESSTDFYERLIDDEDQNCNEIESYEVITEYR